MMNHPNISVITSLYRSENFLAQFLKFVTRIDNANDVEFIFVHNDPSEFELDLIHQFIATKFVSVNHIVVPREGLYTSWNRGIKASKGNFIAIWNVDDIRTSNSLRSQKDALENSGAVLSYGDFYGTIEYGEIKNRLFQYNKDYNALREIALREHIIGCFPMWKKEIHEKIGYFDEQFRLVADWDFQVKVALNYDLVKADEMLGYYLTDMPHKLSSNQHLQYKEQTTVKLRYKIYDQVLMHYLFQINKFKVHRFLNFGEWIDMEKVCPDLSKHSIKDYKLLFSLPFIFFAWGVEKVSGRILQKIGLQEKKKKY